MTDFEDSRPEEACSYDMARGSSFVRIFESLDPLENSFIWMRFAHAISDSALAERAGVDESDIVAAQVDIGSLRLGALFKLAACFNIILTEKESGAPIMGLTIPTILEQGAANRSLDLQDAVNRAGLGTALNTIYGDIFTLRFQELRDLFQVFGMSVTL